MRGNGRATDVMALGRRPARFESRHSMPSRSTAPITHHNLHLLRAAAARVYIHNHQEADNDDNNKAAGAEVEEADPEHGVKLLAAAAAQTAKQ